MTDHEKLCKKFTELTGGHWHEWKNSIGFTHRPNPTYTNPIDVLGIMKRRDAAIKLFNEKQAERDRELDRNYVAPYGRAKSLLPMYGLTAMMSLGGGYSLPRNGFRR